ncbi:ATP-binding protein [Streptomyces scabiei]|uniref:ATP-binding protein n=1 Tax=Streptomyces scabiei TaxID=1930 RepID=UPI0033D95B2F
MRTNQHHEQGVFVARSAFPRRPEAVGPARNWAAQVYREWGGGSEEQAEICALLVSELATNAVLHADGERFEVTVWPKHVIDVRDTSTEKPEARASGMNDENGRGLLLVDALSEEFEVIQVDGGKIVRFRLAREG